MQREPRRRVYAKSEAKAPAIKPFFLSIAECQATGKYVYDRHQHMHFEVLVVERGWYRCRVNGVPLTLKAGAILIVQPGDWHEDTLEKPLRYLGVSFAVEVEGLTGDLQLFNDRASAQDRVIDPPPAAVWLLLERLRSEDALDDGIASHVQDALIAEFFWLLARAVKKSARSSLLIVQSEAERFMTRLSQIFMAHEHSPLSVPAMARELGISASALTGKCRTWLKKSPAHAFRAYKMDRARALLTRTDMSVTEVSNHLGFENPYHFSRVFRQHHGRPPSKVARRP